MAPRGRRQSPTSVADIGIWVPEPRLSLVVTTRNRHDSLGRMLRSLEAGAEDHELPGQVELLLIEDGPPYLGQPPPWPGPVVHVRHESCLGMAAARNEGVMRSTAPLVAFLDD